MFRLSIHYLFRFFIWALIGKQSYELWFGSRILFPLILAAGRDHPWKYCWYKFTMWAAHKD